MTGVRNNEQLRFKIEECIAEIMTFFDFETVHVVMTHLNWKWAGCESMELTIIKEEVLKTFRRFADEFCASNHKRLVMETGGFRYEIERSESDICIQLNFCVSSCDTFKELHSINVHSPVEVESPEEEFTLTLSKEELGIIHLWRNTAKESEWLDAQTREEMQKFSGRLDVYLSQNAPGALRYSSSLNFGD